MFRFTLLLVFVLMASGCGQDFVVDTDDASEAVLERFFRGSFFSAITNLHPEVLIKKLNDEVENYA